MYIFFQAILPLLCLDLIDSVLGCQTSIQLQHAIKYFVFEVGLMGIALGQLRVAKILERKDTQ